MQLKIIPKKEVIPRITYTNVAAADIFLTVLRSEQLTSSVLNEWNILLNSIELFEQYFLKSYKSSVFIEFRINIFNREGRSILV